MPLINCIVELKLKWTKHCVLTVVGNDNTNGNSSNINFTMNYTELHVPVVTLSAKYNQKPPKRHSKRFKRLVYWNEYKANSENKDTAIAYRYFR